MPDQNELSETTNQTKMNDSTSESNINNTPPPHTPSPTSSSMSNDEEGAGKIEKCTDYLVTEFHSISLSNSNDEDRNVANELNSLTEKDSELDGEDNRERQETKSDLGERALETRSPDPSNVNEPASAQSQSPQQQEIEQLQVEDTVLETKPTPSTENTNLAAQNVHSEPRDHLATDNALSTNTHTSVPVTRKLSEPQVLRSQPGVHTTSRLEKTSTLWDSFVNVFYTAPTYEADQELDDACEWLLQFAETFAKSSAALSIYKNAYLTMVLQHKHLAKSLNDEGLKSRGNTGSVLRNIGESLREVNKSQEDLQPLLTRMVGTWNAFLTRGIADARQSADDVQSARQRMHAALQKKLKTAKVGNHHLSEPYLIHQALEEDFKIKRETLLAKVHMIEMQHANIFRRDLQEFEAQFLLHAQYSAGVLRKAASVHKEIMSSAVRTPHELSETLTLARRRSIRDLNNIIV
eukprot:CFRG2726T1